MTQKLSQPGKTFKGFVSQRFNLLQDMREKKGKKCHQPGKSTNFPAFFSYKLYDCHKEEGVECFALKIKMNSKRPNWILVWKWQPTMYGEILIESLSAS